MHPQLELLLQIQDLRAQRQQLEEGSFEREFEEREFGFDVPLAIEHIEEKIEEIRGELEPGIRNRFDRIANAGGRPVAPLINGVCYGCFLAIPTAEEDGPSRAPRDAAQPHEALRQCSNCGRFLYRP